MVSTKTDYVIETIGKRIVQGIYDQSSMIPSEATLCEEFSLSRSVIREALRSLMTKNLIENIPYHGCCVRPQSRWNYLDADVLDWVLNNATNPSLLISLNEVRNIFEPIISRWAALRATSEDLANIEKHYHDMVANKYNREKFNMADTKFHQAILNATHNLIIQQLNNAFGALQNSLFIKSWALNDENISLDLQKHYNLLNAIRLQNGDAAEKISFSLIDRTNENLKLDSIITIDIKKQKVDYEGA